MSSADAISHSIPSQGASRFGGDIETKMVALETAQHHLYAAGARNFLFVDLPPIERSPGVLRARKFI